ncbi:MAG TPA: SMP-30/gluconolactonase/LRE family protein [Gemmatimonadaceae bacterium]|nr:SMP-30/gluconolactonase/LRE family protein [Gemmatimonadaceae bacterium]
MHSSLVLLVLPARRVILWVAAASLAAACTVRDERPTRDTALPGVAAAAADTQQLSTSRVLTIDGGFQTPESVLHDRDLDVYFVSNINGNPSAADDNGFISRLRPDGTIDSLRFIAGGRGGVTLNAPKGMAVRGDTLWVADIDHLRGYHKRTGALVANVSLAAQSARFLNDVAVGPDGAIYITDTGIQFAADGSMTAPGPYRIFRVGPQGRAVTVAIEGDTLARPNGITWDARNERFIVVQFGGTAVLGWRPGQAAPTRIAVGPGQFDGVEVLVDGRILVSSWADSSIHVIDATTMRRAIGGVNAPADIGVDRQRNRVLIPLFMDNRVEVWDLRN